MKRKESTLESSSSTDRAPAEGPSGVGPPDDAVLVGRLGKPNGLEGFLGLYTESENLAYFEPPSTVFIAGRPCEVRAVRQGKKGPQVAFEGITDRAGAERLRGHEVFADQRRQLGQGEYWPQDLVGLEVRPGGGEVVAVIHGAAQDRLAIQRQDIRFEVPFVDELVPTVDLERGFIEVVEIDGLSSP